MGGRAPRDRFDRGDRSEYRGDRNDNRGEYRGGGGDRGGDNRGGDYRGDNRGGERFDRGGGGERQAQMQMQGGGGGGGGGGMVLGRQTSASASDSVQAYSIVPDPIKDFILFFYKAFTTGTVPSLPIPCSLYFTLLYFYFQSILVVGFSFKLVHKFI